MPLGRYNRYRNPTTIGIVSMSSAGLPEVCRIGVGRWRVLTLQGPVMRNQASISQAVGWNDHTGVQDGLTKSFG